MATTNGVPINGAPTSGAPIPPSNPPKPNHVIIIGGSLGGLFAGVTLKSHGIRTTILERNPTNLLHNQGAGIVAGGDTLAWFTRYDRFSRPVAVPSRARVYLSQSGNVVHTVTEPGNMTSWDLCYYLLRANYDGIDSAYLAGADVANAHRAGDGDVEYRYGCTVTAITEDASSGVTVAYTRSDGSSETMTGDMVIGADGPSSTVRSLMLGPAAPARTYAGYCVIRGTVPEREASAEAAEAFVEKFTFYHGPGVQNLTYTIPGPEGAMGKGERLLNFVWYTNFAEGGEELEELMTDKQGKRRRITVAPGAMREVAWAMVKKRAEGRLPPQMAEMVRKTRQPFVQAITDVVSPRNSFMGGKVVLVGDALAGFRPHTVASTSQAAFDVMVLAEWLQGKIGHDDFVRRTMEYGRLMQHLGTRIGDRSQFGDLPLQELIEDRDWASIKREDRVYPEWTQVTS